MKVLNISGYKFRKLADLPEKKEKLLEICKSAGLKGTILIGHEGVNAFLAGDPDTLRATLKKVMEVVGEFEVKESFSDSQPFRRMLVKIKKEIVTMGQEFDIQANASKYVKPQEFKKWMDENEDMIVIDTRNDYELRLGKFENAVDLDIKTFRAFPEKVAQFPEEWKDKKIVTFCTGGIRCEKAAPWMVKEGFKNVYQLEGGILKYFEEVGGSHYEGDCFVFDHRTALDPSLDETDTTQCFICREPVTAEEQKMETYKIAESCPRCAETRA